MTNTEFEQLYNQHYKDVYYIVSRMVRDEETAKDITQETFLKAYSEIDTLENVDKFGPWVKSIANHNALNYLKRKQIINFESIDADENFEVSDDRKGPEETSVDKDVQEILLKLIDELPEEQKITLFLYYFEDMSIKEIAAACECSEKTIYSRLAYAKKALRNKVEKVEDKGTLLRCIVALPFLYIIFQMEAREAYAATIVEPFPENLCINKSALSGTKSGGKIMKKLSLKAILGCIAGGVAIIAAIVAIIVNTSGGKKSKQDATKPSETTVVSENSTTNNGSEDVTTASSDTNSDEAQYTELSFYESDDTRHYENSTHSIVGNIIDVTSNYPILSNLIYITDTGVWIYETPNTDSAKAAKGLFQVYAGNDIEGLVFTGEYESLVCKLKNKNQWLLLDFHNVDVYNSDSSKDIVTITSKVIDIPADYSSMYEAHGYDDNNSSKDVKRNFLIQYFDEKKLLHVIDYDATADTTKTYLLDGENKVCESASEYFTGYRYYSSLEASADSEKIDTQPFLYGTYNLKYVLLNDMLCYIYSNDIRKVYHSIPGGYALLLPANEGDVAYYENTYKDKSVATVHNVTKLYDAGEAGNAIFYASGDKLFALIENLDISTYVKEIPIAEAGYKLDDIKDIEAFEEYAYITFNDDSVYYVCYKNEDKFKFAESKISSYNKAGHVIAIYENGMDIVVVMDDNYTYEIKEK